MPFADSTRISAHASSEFGDRDTSETLAQINEMTGSSEGGEWQEVRGALTSIESDLRRPILESDTISYADLVITRLNASSAGAVDATGRDVDEWILKNERWLRSSNGLHWSCGLVKIQDFSGMFRSPSSDSSAITIVRPESMSGHNILDLKRAARIRLQPSASDFAKSFHHITQGVLKGVDWNNLFVAGGIVLGTLLSPPDVAIVSQITSDSEFTKSDIDLYIYGLGPVAACQKIKEVYDIIQSNLGPDVPILVVRNSKTITFFAKYPIRRIQIVLKLVKNPKDVLLNFDLDICAIGFDGEEVFMLPRAVRALETGYNVFTMDLIHGHFLGDRRASQQDRIFKYANRGYGIRILPSYVDALRSHDLGVFGVLGSPPFRMQDIDTIAKTSKQWVSRLIDRYVKWGHTTTPTVVPSPISQGIRESWSRETIPVFTHAMLESRKQIKSDFWSPRSCLSGFALLMRHVALWERGVKGHIRLEEDIWASQVYSASTADGYSYYDTPKYPWDDSFTLDGFVAHIDAYNTALVNAMHHDNASGVSPTHRVSFDRLAKMGIRMTYASDVSLILDSSHNIVVPIFLSEMCVHLINRTVWEALCHAGVENPQLPLRVIDSCMVHERELVEEINEHGNAGQVSIPVAWTLDSISMWQQIDRRIDEIFELIWASYRSLRRSFISHDVRISFEERLLAIVTGSPRSPSLGHQNEHTAFVKWVNTDPLDDQGNYGVMGEGWSHDTDSDKEGSENDFGSEADTEDNA
ncbi:hypothetical protein SISNIDRAFT_469445 [Sistotremastrum niveocremeum HHB9708]|uniref:Uncharacterized protein n=1 Tax=Sistotremastrum niveocremeum HHB9708 TaxID=1314777 RepID=A0A164Q8G0_9AGAM|nr:hypothetical protein SISNIDRAFT_469445 [Sistotremastrum niveocremeum HHB9708]